jgi:hypothetical protein
VLKNARIYNNRRHSLGSTVSVVSCVNHEIPMIPYLPHIGMKPHMTRPVGDAIDIPYCLMSQFIPL